MFDAWVLGHAEKSRLPTNSKCAPLAAAPAPDLVCADTTQKVLNVVSSLPGELGYAQTGEVAAFSTAAGNQVPGLQPVSINGHASIFENIGRSAGSYPFWTVEYVYSYGPPTGLAAAFLADLRTQSALNVLTSAGYTPCPSSGPSRAWSLCKNGS